MSKDLIKFFKFQKENTDMLTAGEASSHMLAIKEFIEIYFDQYMLAQDDNLNQQSFEFEKRKIVNFLSLMTNILAESNSENRLYDAVIISRLQLSDIKKELNKIKQQTYEEIDSALKKSYSLHSRLQENMKKLSN